MEEKKRKPLVILMADDDPDDIMLVGEALEETRFRIDFRPVKNGDEAMDYLLGRGRYESSDLSPRPDLILLDLNMPPKGGIETLKEIKNIPKLREIPIVILTTSSDQKFMSRAYSLGASSFITKPIIFSEIIKAMESLCSYWFGTVSLPAKRKDESPDPEK